LRARLDHFGILAPVYERFIPAKVSERLLALVDAPAGGTIIDCAGGTGRVAQFLLGKDAQVVVADETLEMLREANKKSGVKTVCSHAEQLPFQTDYFDRIVMVDAMHHVADQRATARELLRILKPGGRIVIEELDVRSFGIKLVALAEKLALMRSHFLSTMQITRLFRSDPVHVHVAQDGTTAWIVVDKENTRI
jgi:ubiquinone/menaquinone biosynthesis C-methylase UbiE